MTLSEGQGVSAPTREVLHAALDLPAEQRRAYVEERIHAGDTLEDVLGMLAEVDSLGSFLEEPAKVLKPRPFKPMLPDRIGNYRVERVLGWGSMGVVYLGKQDSPNRPVALKVLRMDAGSSTTARRFEQEGEVLARLSHPGIAAVIEAGVTDLGVGPQPFLAMEYVDGLSLGLYAERNSLDRRERVVLLSKIARAVAHAHREGVLHRDLKPENILVRKNGEPCILDFGVAHATHDEQDFLSLTVTGQILGTLAYMAPEQARGGRIDMRADQFALGAILCELLTGELPFDVRGRLPHEALRVIANEAWNPPVLTESKQLGDLEAVLNTVLAPEPAQRFASVDALADDLDRWLRGDAVLARTPSAVDTLLRSIRRNARLSALIVLVSIGFGAALAWGTSAIFDLRREETVSLLFSDRQQLRTLEREAETLWPTKSSHLPAFDAWLQRAAELAERLPHHRATVGLLGEGGADATATGSTLGAEWLMDEGRSLVETLEVFTEETIPEMARRRSIAERLVEETLVVPRRAWKEAVARVAADPRFQGFGLSPQEGLVPLGPDNDSKLEEFALWSTGTLPTRNAEGRIEPREEHALVFVLIPGGEHWVGGQSEDPNSPNYAAHVNPHEGPPKQVRLDPFLISKYEFTQAQWVRLFGENPSDWEIGSVIKEQTITGLHPVESVSWKRVMTLLPQVGLTLPTEAQWERAAQADHADAYLGGSDWRALIGQVNWNVTAEDLAKEPELVDDGYYSHMPIGSFRPNGFGLHDVMGNVWEYCLDVYKVAYHELEHEDGHGRVIAEPDGDVSRRGIGCVLRPHSLDVYARSDKRFDGRDAQTGLRPLRPLAGTEVSVSLPKRSGSRATGGRRHEF